MFQCLSHEVWVAMCGNVDEVDLSAEEVFQPLEEPKIAVCRTHLSRTDERDEEIEIAGGWVKISAGGGAEQLEAADLVLAAQGFQLLATLFD